MQASQIFEIVIVTLIFSDVVPQLKLRLFSVLFQAQKPLCCLTYHFHFHCSVFKVQSPASFEARFEDLTFQLGLQIQQQTLFGGPEWARTTDLTIISRTL